MKLNRFANSHTHTHTQKHGHPLTHSHT